MTKFKIGDVVTYINGDVKYMITKFENDFDEIYARCITISPLEQQGESSWMNIKNITLGTKAITNINIGDIIKCINLSGDFIFKCVDKSAKTIDVEIIESTHPIYIGTILQDENPNHYFI